MHVHDRGDQTPAHFLEIAVGKRAHEPTILIVVARPNRHEVRFVNSELDVPPDHRCFRFRRQLQIPNLYPIAISFEGDLDVVVFD